ncbi:MAG: hypothetical protein JO316_09165 [Abitibacteriaceae bacterium]|nr:hypothetical protein [Abditibacteriaceae bacterium]MBV9865506.1 hypothetical protein [Abditibacteriaceae bacterium]
MLICFCAHIRNLVTLSVVLLLIGGAAQSLAQEAQPPALTQPARPKNTTSLRKIESTVTAINTVDGKVTLTLKDGALSVALTPQTELVQEERNIVASSLKVDDTLCLIRFRARGSIKEKGSVTTINPLTVKIANMGTLMLTNIENVSFSRYSPLQSTALAVGQTVAIDLHVSHDGEIEAKRVAVVVVPKTQAPKRTKQTTQRKPVKQDVKG